MFCVPADCFPKYTITFRLICPPPGSHRFPFDSMWKSTRKDLKLVEIDNPSSWKNVLLFFLGKVTSLSCCATVTNKDCFCLWKVEVLRHLNLDSCLLNCRARKRKKTNIWGTIVTARRCNFRWRADNGTWISLHFPGFKVLKTYFLTASFCKQWDPLWTQHCLLR